MFTFIVDFLIMTKRKISILLLLIIALSLSKQYWIGNHYNFEGSIKFLNKYAQHRVPFKRNEALSVFAKKISHFQQNLLREKKKTIEKRENKIVNRQQEIINQLIKNGDVKCNRETSDFGLTILPSNIQLEKNGLNLTQPKFPLSVISQGKHIYFQIVVTAYKEIDYIELEFLNSTNESIQCYLGDYVYCNPSPYFNKSKLYQDPLFPFEKKDDVFKIDRKNNPIKQESSYPIWVKLEQPEATNNLQFKITVNKKHQSILESSISSS
jgi:hypothetical protein